MAGFERMTMSDGAEIAVYRAQPMGERRGGVVLVQEIFGVTDHIREMADEYAADGYEVLAPALFDRDIPGSRCAYGGDGLAEGIRLARAPPRSRPASPTCRPASMRWRAGRCSSSAIATAGRSPGSPRPAMHGVAAASGYYGGLIPARRTRSRRCRWSLHFGRFD